MKYLVLRVKDERSSQLCAKIEAFAIASGGLEFPFSFDSFYFDSNNLNAGLSDYGETYTKTFHENCRCSLVPISQQSLVRYGEPDLLDKHMLIDSALSHDNQDMALDGVTPETISSVDATRFTALLKLYLNNS